MAGKTRGEFFLVSDREALEQSFHQILDALEKTDIEDAGRMYTALFPAFVAPAFLFLLVELLVVLWLRRWPCLGRTHSFFGCSSRSRQPWQHFGGTPPDGNVQPSGSARPGPLGP